VTNQGLWQTGYASATTIPGLVNANHVFLNVIRENYFCAPQVFYFEPQGTWYMVYNSGTYGAAYATTTDIADPDSWEGPQNLGLPDPVGYDYFIICDDKDAYIFYSESGEARKVIWRRTPLSSFPSGWSSAQTAVTDTFEGVAVYKCLSDGKYYLLCEDYNDNRYYGLWTSSGLAGPWSQVAIKWASQRNISFTKDAWTDNISHGEILRSGYNQKIEINDIDRADYLIQGAITNNVNYGEYWQIPWDLGIIRNYSGTITTSTGTQGLPGDVNLNGVVDIIDALLVAQHYVGLNPATFDVAAADTNCDGSVDIVDALLIAQYYVGLLVEFCQVIV